MTGLQERRSSSGGTDRPPLSPWCNASTHRLSQHQYLMDSRLQVSSETNNDSLPSSAYCAQYVTVHEQTHIEDHTDSQPSAMVAEVACSQFSKGSRHSEWGPSGIGQQQHVSLSHGSHADMGQSYQGCHHQQLLPSHGPPLQASPPNVPPLVSSSCMYIHAESPILTNMEIDTEQSQQPDTAAPVSVCVNGSTDMAQMSLLNSAHSLPPELTQDLLPEHTQSAPAALSQSCFPEWTQTSVPELTEASSPPCSIAPPQVLPQSPRLGQEQIADRQRSFSPLSRGPVSVLPTTENSETGLPSISCSTLAQLLTGQHSFAIGSLQLIDCR